MTRRRAFLYPAMVVIFLAGLFAGVAFAVNGGLLTTLNDSNGQGHRYQIWTAVDADVGTLTGVPIYLGSYEAMMVIPQIGVDATNTFSVDCGASGSTTTAPTTWDQVLGTTAALDTVVMPPGHICEWVRVNVVASDGAATTIWVYASRRRR